MEATGDRPIEGIDDGETAGMIDGAIGCGALHALRKATRSKKKRGFMVYSIE
jgi:hypothetical protein